MKRLARVYAHPLGRLALGLAGLGLGALLVARFALERRLPPERCPVGMLALGPRCCGAGQTLVAGDCTGRAQSCSSAQELDAKGQCVARSGVVSFTAGELQIGAADWEGATGAERFPRTHVDAFQLDRSEVTLERWLRCSACPPRAGEPGLPLSDVTPAEAEVFCQSQAGRLPTAAEWVWAAAGGSARRYAWGNSGLVCRRAAFGLEHGPCADGGRPELAGSRPDGASPEGVLDLSGNVAEWTRERAGGYAARGGSYRSTAAADLKAWAAVAPAEKALHIGFRCAYPAGP
ncbi:MAG TPA: SUMF1/EgtB/PvdO family nonheme iron enzyme [Polyangiaceae bacterium]